MNIMTENYIPDRQDQVEMKNHYIHELKGPHVATTAELLAWRNKCRAMQEWCNEQGFTWGLCDITNRMAVKFYFSRSEELTMFLLKWA